MLERREGAQTSVRLDRGRILTAAARIVGEEGLKGLTVRRIGAELDVDPTAIYRHFRNKEEMLTCLTEWLFDDEPDLDPDASWQERLRILIDHSFARYHVHPDLGILLASQDDDLPPLVRFRESVMELLVNDAGLTIPSAAMIDSLIEQHVVGGGLYFAVAEYPAEAEEYGARMRRTLALLPHDDYPRVSAAAPFMFPDPKEVFDRMTNLLIETIERAGRPVPKEETP
jgi:AcrR family transcriptional regulator